MPKANAEASDDLFDLDAGIPSAGVVVIVVSGDVDLGTAPRLESAARYYLNGYRPRKLALDLSGVRFFGSAGVSALLGIEWSRAS